jgi:type III pantothenate kinase
MVMKKGLVIDIGNTRSKAAVFEDGKMLSTVLVFFPSQPESLIDLIELYKPSHSIVVSVSNLPDTLVTFLNQHSQLFILTQTATFPFTSEYATPQTLGMDRAAGVAGAMQLFAQQHCLVIDAGTCVTFDFVTKEGIYMGGAISPGLNMRLKAMHTFTQKLPDVAFEFPKNHIGNSTTTSMLSGAYFGLLGEINETISRYEDQFGIIQVVLCGGDAVLFDKRTKKSIFASPDLVLHGLFKILQLNAT